MSYQHPTPTELARNALAHTMRNISESGWRVGWTPDLEYTLWDALTISHTHYGMGIEEVALARLRHLHEVTGGWWTWSKSEGRPNFVTTQEWLQIYADARKGKSKKKQD